MTDVTDADTGNPEPAVLAGGREGLTLAPWARHEESETAPAWPALVLPALGEYSLIAARALLRVAP